MEEPLKKSKSKLTVEDDQLRAKSLENSRHSEELTLRLKESYKQMKARVKRKLRDTPSSVSPSISVYTTIDGCARVQLDVLDLKTLPRGAALNIRRKTRVDKLREEVVKPKRHIPPTHLPDWVHLPLDVKLPLVEAGNSLKYSRGYLCQPLDQKLKTSLYTVYDPYHKERTIQAYNPLHDPHNSNYLRKPQITRLLKKQGLIGDDGEVLCNVSQFNEYRLYLKHRHNELDKKITYLDDSARQSRVKDAVLLHDYRIRHNKTQRRIFRAQQRVRAKREEEYQEKLQTLQKNEQIEAGRAANLRYRLYEERQIRRARNALMEKRRNEAYARAKKARIDRTTKLFVRSLGRELAFAARARRRKLIAREITRQYHLRRLTDKYEFQREHRQVVLAIGEAVEHDLNVRTKRNLRYNEHQRKAIAKVIAKRKAEEARIFDLLYKYFHRWLSVVRKRRQLRPDVEHISLWDVDAIISESVDYIRHQAGIEKFDNLVLNILKLKFTIKKELTDEEVAAEAERLARLDSMDSSVSIEDIKEENPKKNSGNY